MYIQELDLDMLPGAVPVHVKCNQYDQGTSIRFTLYLNGERFIPAVTPTAMVQGTKPDGNGYTAACNYASGMVRVDLTEQMTACYGSIPFEICLSYSETKNDQVVTNTIGTANFILDVEESPLQKDTIISETDLTIFQSLLNQANSAANQSATNAAKIARGHGILTDFAKTTSYASVFSSGQTNMDYTGYYQTANKSDSYSGDTACKHICRFMIPQDKNFGCVVVFSEKGTHVGFYNSSSNTVTWAS